MTTMYLEKPWPDSNWLEENCVGVALPAREKFYAPTEKHAAPKAAQQQLEAQSLFNMSLCCVCAVLAIKA